MVAGRFTVGVLALQGEVARHLAAVLELGARAVPVRTPDQLAEVDGLILPGGESTTMSMLLQSSGLLEPLRQRLADGLPAFGTCAGMILLARRVLDGRPDQQQLGAIDITVRRNAFGRQLESFETDLDVAGLDDAAGATIGEPAVDGSELGGSGVGGPAGGGSAVGRPELAGSGVGGPAVGGSPPKPLHAVFIRAPLVEAVGPGVDVLAKVEGPGGDRRAVVCRQGPVLVAAFHPELSGDWRLHRWFLANVMAGAGRQPAGIE